MWLTPVARAGTNRGQGANRAKSVWKEAPAKVAPQDAPKEVAKDASKEAPVDAAKETRKDTSNDASKDSPKEAVKETAKSGTDNVSEELRALTGHRLVQKCHIFIRRKTAVIRQ